MVSTQPISITIGIMTHNYGHYIIEAIESVLAQSRTDWEMIISDDASTDGTDKIVAPYLTDPRIQYVRHEKNLGQAKNWEFLLGQGSAPILGVLHADDIWLPKTLELALSAFEANPDLDLFHGNWWLKIEGQSECRLANREKPHLLSGYEAYKYQIRKNTLLPSASFLTRRVIHATGIPNSDLKMLVDYEYFLRICTMAIQVQSIEEPVMTYRVHNASTTAQSSANGVYNRECELLADICAIWATEPRLQSCLAEIRYVQARQIFNDGVGAYANGNIEKGNDIMQRSLTLSTRILTDPKVTVDFLLSRAGNFGLPLFRWLHRARIATEMEIV